MVINPKDFFQQVKNLCEELGLQMKSLAESLSTFITKDEAEKYLEKTEAANTYLGKDEKAASATVADSATSANKATNDANGNNISNTYLKSTTAASTYLKQSDADSKYLGKTAKAESAKTADTATSATSAGSATKAIQDGDGNVISGTYLKSATAQSTYLSKTDAASTYLGKTAKAVSATTADSATKATQDGSGNNIEQTYAKKSEIPEVDTSALVMKEGNRGQLAGYETPTVTANAVTINADSNDTTQVTGAVAVTVATGAEGTSWTKTVSLVNASATVTLGDAWVWSGGEAPTVSENGILVLHWCNDVGVANLIEGAHLLRTYSGTINASYPGVWISRGEVGGSIIYELQTGTTPVDLAVGDNVFHSGAFIVVEAASGIQFEEGTSFVSSKVTYVEDGFSVVFSFKDYDGNPL